MRGEEMTLARRATTEHAARNMKALAWRATTERGEEMTLAQRATTEHAA